MGIGITLGGPKARFQRLHGDIMASYQYVNGERAMALWPVRRRGVPAFIVCESSAWKYDDEHYLAQQARHVANLWGEAPGGDRWFQIAKIIHDGLGDLIRMKPEVATPETGIVIGEATLRADGKEVTTRDVRLPSAADFDRFDHSPPSAEELARLRQKDMH